MANLITTTKVSIDDIKEVPEYKELMPENNSYEELKGSIQQLGFLDPILISELPRPNGASCFKAEACQKKEVEVSAPQALRVVPTPIFSVC